MGDRRRDEERHWDEEGGAFDPSSNERENGRTSNLVLGSVIITGNRIHSSPLVRSFCMQGQFSAAPNLRFLY